MSTSSDELSKADQLLTAIKAYPDPRRASAEWKQVYAILKKTAAAGNHLDNVVASRDVTALAKTISDLRIPADVLAQVQGGDASIDEATLRAALKGFKRRLKMTQLEEESRIDLRDPMSKGAARIAAIEPPREWPAAVWAELTHRGCLRRTGGGLYEFAADLPA